MLSYLALSPHPPMIIPAIGGKKLKDVAPTVRGMQEMAKSLVASQPEAVVFLTPHGNVFSDCITCLGTPDLYGDMSNFGCPEISFNYPNDIALIREISLLAVDAGIDFIIIDEDIARNNRLNERLDHGIQVPLYYLRASGLGEDTPLVAISVGGLSVLDLYSLGKYIRQAADNLGKKIAIVASGDMSHRLKNDGPYNFHPDGVTFDKLIKEYLAAADTEAILNIPDSLLENAGECGYRSIVIMLGAMDGFQIRPQIFAYEGPFGVGYLTAGFKLGEEKMSYLDKLKAAQAKELKSKREAKSLPVRWARLVLENYVTSGVIPELPEEWHELRGEKAAAFVTLKKEGSLRGCIGTIMPAYANLAEELANNAVSAGTNDPRFMPVEVSELEQLEYSVDILGTPEKCGREDLDPKEYGVIVTKGRRRGLLLPALDGVDTVEEQLAIVLEKARISPEEDYEIERFKVVRYY